MLGLGSNLGSRLSTLRTAAHALAQRDGVRLVTRSWVYETPPAGGPAQPDYLNAAIRVLTNLPPLALLRTTRAVERQLGRVRVVRWGPRTIDIDILWATCKPLATPPLQIPHAGLPIRPFALRPLLDVAPLACDPTSGRRYAGRAAATQAIARVALL